MIGSLAKACRFRGQTDSRIPLLWRESRILIFTPAPSSGLPTDQSLTLSVDLDSHLSLQPMSLPNYQDLMLPLLRVLYEAGEGVHQLELTRRVADAVGLTGEQRQITLPSGNQTAIHNRTGWAGWYMKQAGLLENVKRGVWAITEEGRKLLARNPADH